MKKIFFTLIALCFILLSCKKDHKKPGDTSTALHKVNLNVGFSQQLVNFSDSRMKVNSTTDTALLHNVSVLYYDLFDANGVYIKQMMQTSTQTDFGTFSDNLPSGTYTVVISGGGDNRLSVVNANKGLSEMYLTYSSHEVYDTFYKKFSLTVSSTSTSQSVALDRITALVEVNIKDALPANTRFIQIRIFDGQSGILDIRETDWHIANQYGQSLLAPAQNYTSAQTGTINNKLSTFIIPNATNPYTVEIICSAQSGGTGTYGEKPPDVIAEKFVTGITIQANHKIDLSGKLFGLTGPNGTQAQADTAWSTTTINKSF